MSQFVFCLFSFFVVRTRRTWYQAVKRRAFNPHNLLSFLGAVWSHAIVFIFISQSLMGRRYTWSDGVLVAFIFYTTVLEGELGLLSFFRILIFMCLWNFLVCEEVALPKLFLVIIIIITTFCTAATKQNMKRLKCHENIFIFFSKCERTCVCYHTHPRSSQTPLHPNMCQFC